MKHVLELPSNFHQSPSTTGLDGYGYKPKSDILQLLFSQLRASQGDEITYTTMQFSFLW